MRYSDSGNRITADSLAFYREHRHRLGRIVAVRVRFPGFDDPYDPYLMTLTDETGDQIRLSGCTTGYPGEGPRATMRLLVEEGWPTSTAATVLTAATATFDRAEKVSERTTPRRPAHEPNRRGLEPPSRPMRAARRGGELP
jgi:hypothetical protein